MLEAGCLWFTCAHRSLPALPKLLGSSVPHKTHQHSASLLVGRQHLDVPSCVGRSLQKQLVQGVLGQDPKLNSPSAACGAAQPSGN